MRGKGIDSLLYKRGPAVLAAVVILMHLTGCGIDVFLLSPREETAVESESGERHLALEEIESRAQEYASDGSQTGDPADETESAPTEDGASEEPSSEENVFAETLVSFEGSCDHAYRSLSEAEQLWYTDMVRAISTMTDKVKLSAAGINAGLDDGDVDRIFQCVQDDHPEFFYVEGYTYSKHTRAEKTVAIEFSGNYSMDRDAVLKRNAVIEEAAGKILTSVPKGADDYTKAKYVYETLILQTEYDMKAEDNQNIYSVFVNHASVCQGYAKAAQFLLNRMGIECALVHGYVLETGEAHAWNLLKMDGQYYYMDPTWGDISYQSASAELGAQLTQISYDYFGISTAQLLRTHKIESAVPMPSCTAQEDNYYVREGALFTDYDTEQLKALVDRLSGQGRSDITIRCGSDTCFQKMYHALVEEQEIFDFIPGDDVQTFAYTTNEAQLTMTFFMMTSER